MSKPYNEEGDKEEAARHGLIDGLILPKQGQKSVFLMVSGDIYHIKI
jgi:hypothetical protein